MTVHYEIIRRGQVGSHGKRTNGVEGSQLPFKDYMLKMDDDILRARNERNE